MAKAKDAVFLLTRAEAFEFLQNNLKMTSIDKKLNTDRVAFLNELIDLFQQTMPFQSITTNSRSKEDQHLSTLIDIKRQMFSYQGGLCYDHNIFMKCLLETLGFDVSLAACDIEMNGIHDHVLVLVRNLSKPGDLYHVDVGVGDPFFQAIPLDFEQESKIYKTGFLTHKFTKEDDVYTWFRMKDGLDDHENGLQKFMTFTLERRTIDYFHSHMIRHFVPPDQPLPGLTFLENLRAVIYPDQKLLGVVGTTFMREDDEGKISKTKITSKDELLLLYNKHFPQFPADMVQAAVEKMNYTFNT